jgi:hypothetical protein
MSNKIDKYGREVRVVTISGRQYRILPESMKLTHHIRGLNGKFKGRLSGVQRSDQTQYVRILESIDVNRDKIPDLRPGQIVGRISRYPTLRPRPGSAIQVQVHVSNKNSAKAMKATQKEKFRMIKLRTKKRRLKLKQMKRRSK